MGRAWEKPYVERFALRPPRVYIGVVAFGDIYSEVYESGLHWAFQAGARYKGQFELFFAVASRKEQYRARNSLVLEAQRSGADFMLMLDDDHTLADCPDILGEFYREEKPLQGGLYVQRTNEFEQPVIARRDEKGQYVWCDYDEIPAYPGGPVEVLGGGVNWIDMIVFDFMKQPHWWPYPHDRREVAWLPDERYGLDLQLCIRAQELGITPWLNRRVSLGHVTTERNVLRPQGQQGNVICPRCKGLAIHDQDRWRCNTCQSELAAA